MEVVGSKKKVGCRQSASMIVHLRFFPALPSPFTFVFTNPFVPSLFANNNLFSAQRPTIRLETFPRPACMWRLSALKLVHVPRTYASNSIPS